MITLDDLKAARHNSNFEEILVSYLEPANLYELLEAENEKQHEAFLLSEEEKRQAAKEQSGQQQQTPTAD